MGNYIVHQGHRFEVVNAVPVGYVIWNIGSHNMLPGYLPLCRLKHRQPFEGCMEIEPDTLKAVPTQGAGVILDAIGGGQNTIKSMEAYIRRYSTSKNYATLRKVERMRRALPFMYQIQWYK